MILYSCSRLFSARLRLNLGLTLLLHLLELAISGRSGLGFTLLATLLNLGSHDGISLLDELFHGGVGLLLLETLENLGGVRDGSFIGLGVELGVLIARGIVVG